jgi:hypothetical protein
MAIFQFFTNIILKILFIKITFILFFKLHYTINNINDDE